RFPDLRLDGPVVGVGIEPPPAFHPERFRHRYRLTEPFLLYIGRIDESKGCRRLIEDFIDGRNAGTIAQKLVLAGNEVMPIPFHDDVIYLGFIDDEQKWDALAACDWLIMPSPHESLSMALLEAWAAGRPALVAAEAEVLVGQCRRANAGLWYRDLADLQTILRVIDDRAKEALGANGQRFVEENYSWERVEADYIQLLQT
ncbi:MAG TPA: glycosyltransferase family 4 protein, partial [Chthoniobacterales bacterium]|nr:glycosyltransferase family 4 protein [Chthoniobacterales bacterium]